MSVSPAKSSFVIYPRDGGIHAYTFLIATWVLELLIWSYSPVFGIFYAYYTTHQPFSSATNAQISVIGTVALCLSYCSVALFLSLCGRYPRIMIPLMWSCLLISWASYFATSFCTKVWQLILTQGALFSFTSAAISAPCLIYTNEWFVERRGAAIGFMFTAVGVGGSILPFVFKALLSKLGFAWAMRTWSFIYLAAGAATIPFIKPRLPPPEQTVSRRTWSSFRFNLSFVKSSVFWLIVLSTMFQSLAFFPVSFFIPTYVATLTNSGLTAEVALSIFNICCSISYLLTGFLTDRMSFSKVLAYTSFVAALSAFFIWGFANSLPLAFTFFVVFGLSTGGIGSIWMPAATDIARNSSKETAAASIFGLFTVARGIMGLVGPTVVASIYHPTTAKTLYGNKGFLATCVFTGAFLIAATASGMGSQFAVKKRRMSNVDSTEEIELSSSSANRS